MWYEIKQENSLAAAKKFADNIEKLGGVPSRILPPRETANTTYHVYVPKDKAHLLTDLIKRLSTPPAAKPAPSADQGS